MKNQTNFEELSSAKDIGQLVRRQRKGQKLTLVDAAGLCGVSVRFMSELENGRDTCSIGRILIILQTLGVDLYATGREGESAIP